jgi:PKHD-type hydroxylase
MSIPTEPRWKSLVVTTTGPLFTPEQCQNIIDVGENLEKEKAKVGITHNEKGGYDTKKRTSIISWIPFNNMPQMYKTIEDIMLRTNSNHFGFDGMKITEMAQFTVYPKGGFYDWHMDCDIEGVKEPVVRKISMTILLSPPGTFEGGDLEFMEVGKKPQSLVQGQAIFFASFIRHRVAPVKKGIRKSLVMWFGGPSFR